MSSRKNMAKREKQLKSAAASKDYRHRNAEEYNRKARNVWQGNTLSSLKHNQKKQRPSKRTILVLFWTKRNLPVKIHGGLTVKIGSMSNSMVLKMNILPGTSDHAIY
ncbi:hypothetical protein BDP27DRAFT_1361269 [Rhodocollybia butyracea]|uniref:Uncharacterized protein n=1 Tax=Rhodocollybia butyracea TaxID=206335 RepID=A0A9P5UAM9_9AGAR|nr:hypothetical protein BDP27DRAFT_1361269 [Rhodocollybia butyracea]